MVERCQNVTTKVRYTNLLVVGEAHHPSSVNKYGPVSHHPHPGSEWLAEIAWVADLGCTFSPTVVLEANGTAPPAGLSAFTFSVARPCTSICLGAFVLTAN